MGGHLVRSTYQHSPSPHCCPAKTQKPDYDDILDEDTHVQVFRGKSDKGKDLNKKYGNANKPNIPVHISQPLTVFLFASLCPQMIPTTAAFVLACPTS